MRIGTARALPTKHTQNGGMEKRAGPLMHTQNGGMEKRAGPLSACPGGALTPSNVGFQLLQKSGWKEGSGLGATEQGRLEPVDVYIKNDKRGIGAKAVKQTISSTLRQPIKLHKSKGSEGISKRVVSKKVSRRLKKELESDKKLQEQLLQRDLFMDFWPDNV